MSKAKKDDLLDMSDYVPGSSLVSIKSTWQSALGVTTTGYMQTDPMRINDNFTQTNLRTYKSTQTSHDHKEDGEGTRTRISTSGAPKHAGSDPKTLRAFMDKILPSADTEMKKIEEEHEILEPLNRIVDESKQEPATCTFELQAFGDPSAAILATQHRSNNSRAAALNARHKLVVTCISWSASGQTVAAAYGRHDIPGWCEDRGALATWNLARGNVNQSKADVTIDVDNCLMSCAFHPETPALIAGGTFNGDLFIWDLSVEGEKDMQLGKTDAISDLRHREPIVGMTWQYSSAEYNKYGSKEKAYRLVTLGADGLIMIWTYHKLQVALFGYKLLWTIPGTNQKAIYGGSSMSIQGQVGGANAHHTQLLDGITTLMVGTEGGKIFRCQMELNDAALKDFASKAATATNDKGVDLKSPIKDGLYSSHAGAVLSLHCSPFMKELFITSGYDGSVRLYSSLKKQHLLEVAPSEKPLWTIKWSPFRPFVFATAGSDGRVFFYDLLRVKKGLVSPVLVIEASPDGLPVHSIAFNSTDPSVFATGGSLGTQVWKLPEALGAVQKGEESLLRKVAASEDFEESISML